MELQKDRLLTAKEVASILRVCPRTVKNMGIPKVVFSRRCVRYRLSDVERFIGERIVGRDVAE